MGAGYSALMTITEHLEFSVLTAPIATLDRRSLSQAWYSALYGDGKTACSQTSAAKSRTSSVTAPREPMVQRSVQFHETSASTATHARAAVCAPRGGDVERRGPHSPLARKIERAFVHPRSVSRKAAFALDGEHGRVQVILQSRGSQFKLVAICPPKAKAQVARALAQARYTLAMRGIELEAHARERASC